MKKIFQYIVFIVFFTACTTQQDVIDTGLVDFTPYPGTILDYLKNDTMNFTMMVKIIKLTGLEDLYDGKVDSLPEITFFPYRDVDFGESLEDSKIELYRKYLLTRTAKGYITREDIAKAGEEGMEIKPLLENSSYKATKYLHKVVKPEYLDIPGAYGPDIIQYIYLTYDYYHPSGYRLSSYVLTSNIKTRNGVIHVRSDLDNGYKTER